VVERTSLTLAPDKLLTELSALLGDANPESVVMAFDGDGTLWSGDVGEDLFRAALRDSFLLDGVRPALLAEAARFGLPLSEEEANGSATTIARVLLASYLAGQYPERETCAMMAWCYAGRSVPEVEALSRAVLAEEGLPGRLTPEIASVVAWGRKMGVRMVLISASPRAVVEAAGAYWGFEPGDIAAATPATADGVILPELSSPVPYAETKLSAGRALFGNARWLAAFGDNVFDIDMLKTAEVGVAVRPKPRLELELASLGLRRLSR
jgi:phosphatidylglycerophosphatase C